MKVKQFRIHHTFKYFGFGSFKATAKVGEVNGGFEVVDIMTPKVSLLFTLKVPVNFEPKDRFNSNEAVREWVQKEFDKLILSLLEPSE